MNPRQQTLGLLPPATGSGAPFEKERGVTSVSAQGVYAFVAVSLPTPAPRAHADRLAQELQVYRTLTEAGISINLVKLNTLGLSFVVDADEATAAERVLAAAGFESTVTPSVAMVSVKAGGMRGIPGVMARIAGALLEAQIPILQTGDAPDTVFCLVESHRAEEAVARLRAEFQVAPERPRIVVQKFGGRSVGTADARRLAAERVHEAIEEGYLPVVVVSAIGRMGEPYATDTLLSHLSQVDAGTEPAPRERDMLMACGEIISTVIMAQTLKAIGIQAVALTGGQAGILTDYRYGDAQILDIDPTYIRKLLLEEGVDVVVVAGFQGVTEQGAITTLGRGGSDTTASALAAALGAEKVEIYTHVDGVMTADPEVVPDAHTLSMVTYEEVCNMAHLGAKVLHPRAAEIAMRYQIPLWVKSSFVRSPGTLVAPLAEIEPPTKRAVTGVATLSRLVYFTLQLRDDGQRAEIEYRVYRAIGEAEINFYFNSIGPRTSSFIVDQSAARRVEEILREFGVSFESVENCELVSLVAVSMWEEAGFLLRIGESLQQAGIGMFQMADSPESVSCLVRMEEAPAAARALHRTFELEQ
ncbi:MAG: aspartate kinase [Armatimonadota bacterium]